MTAVSASPVATATGLDCGHGGRPVLRGIELALAPGSITVLLGPNGSGKSTLLKTLAGTLPVLGGTLLVEGKPIATFPPRELARRVAYVPQEEDPQYAFSVAEAVIMGRLPYADSLFDTRDDIEAANLAMEQAGCLDLAGRSVVELSGGELQRVLIARALAQHPALLLLDEPTSHLDVHHGLDLVRTLKKLAATGLTVLAAMHDLTLAARLGDEAILLGGGYARASGAVQRVLEDSALDETFGVAFTRVLVEGNLVLVPAADGN